MFQEINKEWMDDYEVTYRKYKLQWDFHYQKIREFLLSCLPNRIKKLAFIGVTSKIPELDSNLLERIDEIVLLDLYEEGIIEAKKFLKSNFSFDNVRTDILDITFGFVDLIAGYFQEFREDNITEEELFTKLENPSFIYKEYDAEKFDYIAHMGIMDYYLMPLFVQHCLILKHRKNEFFELMKKLNDRAVQISLKMMSSMLSDKGYLIVSSPITRNPMGKGCTRSLFWIQSLKEHIMGAGFEILKESKHIWDEFPEKNGHSHEILNVYCKKA